MRQIILDTETTGLSHETGHRIIEIGCVELIDRKLTGETFHVYLNPEREVDPGAFKVHGISTDFLQDKPFFHQVVDKFLEFILDSELIIHNAVFDIGFLNSELKRLGWPKTIENYSVITDTLVLARKKHPGQKNNLDALCKRYEIDNSNRQFHGALLDAEILAAVYLAMTGGQGSLFDGGVFQEEEFKFESLNASTVISSSPVYAPSSEELYKHKSFIELITKQSGVNLWEEVE